MERLSVHREFDDHRYVLISVRHAGRRFVLQQRSGRRAISTSSYAIGAGVRVGYGRIGAHRQRIQMIINVSNSIRRDIMGLRSADMPSYPRNLAVAAGSTNVKFK